jgi:hypothetical protein
MPLSTCTGTSQSALCSLVFSFGPTWFGGNRAEMASGLVRFGFAIGFLQVDVATKTSHPRRPYQLVNSSGGKVGVRSER